MPAGKILLAMWRTGTGGSKPVVSGDNMQLSTGWSAMFAAAAAVCAAGAADAQELTHKFINPSFGGNPFYSDHLLGVATAQRPERDRTEEEQRELSETEQFARQIQSRLLSALSSSLVEAITGSSPGTTGEFVVGDQRIAFERTLNEIRLTITNNSTGERTEIVVPVLNFNNPSGAPNSALASSSAPALGSSLSTLGGDLVTSAGVRLGSGSLDAGPLEPAGLTSGAPLF